MRLIIGILCIAKLASAEPPHLDGRVAIGGRVSATNDPDDQLDDNGSVGAAVSGLIGFRFDSVLVGLHGGLATPQHFSAGYHYVGEVGASAETTVSSIDAGLGVEVAMGPETWLGGWLGGTVSYKHATSPATHVSAIDHSGDIPAASWRERTTELGVGVAVGRDLWKTAYGRAGLFAAIDVESVGGLGVRDNDGTARFSSASFTLVSVTAGVAYQP